MQADYDARIRQLEQQVALTQEIPALRSKITELEVKMSIVSRLEEGLAELRKQMTSITIQFANFKGQIVGALMIVSLLIPLLTAISLKLMGLSK